MRINGLGCSLVDNLYSPVDFSSCEYVKWSEGVKSKTGIITGGLVFGEDLERTSEIKYREILNEIIGGEISPEKNIGGPSIVALINMAQILDDDQVKIGFFGARGNDENGRYIMEKLTPFGIDLNGYAVTDGQTPFTDVLSDPFYNNSNGERSFINYIGAAGSLTAQDLTDSFFDADILIYGGTALTPCLHDDLITLLKRGRDEGCLNFINTVYDFRNQSLNPDEPWPLVGEEKNYRMIDLLIADNEEALKISGEGSNEKAMRFFADRGVGAVVITHGAQEVLCYSDGVFFNEKGIFCMPVSESAGRRIRSLPSGSTADTTGCGDNFAGGLYASVAMQLVKDEKGKPSLKEAAAWAVVSGGFAGLYQGGVYYEKKAGEKREKLMLLFNEYEKQTGKSGG